MLIPLGIVAASGAGAAGSFESIASASGTGSSATISFTSIPSTYQHLQIRGIAKDTSTSTVGTIAMSLRLNGDSTGTNYAIHRLYGDGAGAYASGAASSAIELTRAMPTSNASFANMVGGFIIDIHDYKSTTKNKTIRIFNGSDLNSGTTASVVNLFSGLWMNTNAVTSVDLVATVNFSTQTQFALYGIKGA